MTSSLITDKTPWEMEFLIGREEIDYVEHALHMPSIIDHFNEPFQVSRALGNNHFDVHLFSSRMRGLLQSWSWEKSAALGAAWYYFYNCDAWSMQDWVRANVITKATDVYLPYVANMMMIVRANINEPHLISRPAIEVGWDPDILLGVTDPDDARMRLFYEPVLERPNIAIAAWSAAMNAWAAQNTKLPITIGTPWANLHAAKWALGWIYSVRCFEQMIRNVNHILSDDVDVDLAAAFSTGTFVSDETTMAHAMYCKTFTTLFSRNKTLQQQAKILWPHTLGSHVNLPFYIKPQTFLDFHVNCLLNWGSVARLIAFDIGRVKDS